MPVMTPDNVESELFAGLKIDRSVKMTNGLFIALYGLGGAGKTTELAKMVLSEHATPTLLVDVEGGSSAVLHLKPLGLDVVHVTRWREILEIRKALKGDHKYKGVVWDNLSEITSLYKNVVAPSGIPEIQEWNKILTEMQGFVREQRDLTETQGINVGFCLWEELIEDKNTKLLRKTVNLFRGFRSVFPGMATQVGRLSVPSEKSDTRLLSFRADERTDSKFRVAPTSNLDPLPREFYLRRETNWIVDFLATMKEGKAFPTEKYAKRTSD